MLYDIIILESSMSFCDTWSCDCDCDVTLNPNPNKIKVKENRKENENRKNKIESIVHNSDTDSVSLCLWGRFLSPETNIVGYLL